MVREGSRTDDDATGVESGAPPAGARSDPFGEARRHLQVGDLRGAARALADLRASAPSSPSAHRAEAARQLCLAGIEHERRAAALDEEVAAQRAAARRSRDQVEALLQDTVAEPDARSDDVTPPGGPPPLALVPDPPDPPRPPAIRRSAVVPSPGRSPAAPSTGGPGDGLVARLLGHFEVEWQGHAGLGLGQPAGTDHPAVPAHRPPPPGASGRPDGAAVARLLTRARPATTSTWRSTPCGGASTASPPGRNVVIHRDGCYLLNPDLDDRDRP